MKRKYKGRFNLMDCLDVHSPNPSSENSGQQEQSGTRSSAPAPNGDNFPVLTYFELTPEEEAQLERNHPQLYRFLKKNPNYQGR